MSNVLRLPFSLVLHRACLRVLSGARRYIESLQQEIRNKGNRRDSNDDGSSIEALYAAVPYLAKIASDGEGDEMDRVLIQRVVDSLNKVCEARHQRESAERGSVSVLTFLFLTMLAFFTFFGTYFLQVGSTTLTNCVVVMTGLSLTCSVIILMDVSLPWRFAIQVDTGIFSVICQDISFVLAHEKHTDAMLEPAEESDEIYSESTPTPLTTRSSREPSLRAQQSIGVHADAQLEKAMDNQLKRGRLGPQPEPERGRIPTEPEPELAP